MKGGDEGRCERGWEGKRGGRGVRGGVRGRGGEG